MFENPTANLSALCNSCAKISRCSSELIFTFIYAGSSIQNASEKFVWCDHLSFCTLHSSSNTTNKNLTAIDLEIPTAVSQQPFRNRPVMIHILFLQWPTLSHPKKKLSFLSNHPVYAVVTTVTVQFTYCGKPFWISFKNIKLSIDT